MKKPIAISICLFLAGLGQASAQAPWSLKDCIDYGLKNFGTVRVAEYQKQIADQAAREAVSAYLPQVSGVGALDNNIKLQSTLLPAGFGGRNEPTRIALGSKYQTSASAQADQVLYDKSLLIGIKAAGPNQQRADLTERQTREDIVYNVAANYYQVMVSRQQIRLLRDNLGRTEQVLKILKLQREQGVIQPLDYNRTEVSYNSTLSQLTVAENNLDQALNRLKFQMGRAPEQPLQLPDSVRTNEAPQAAPVGFDARSLTRFQLSENELTLRQLDLQRTQAGYLPRLTASARYGTLALGNQLGPSLENFTGFGSIGLRLNVPIFDGFRRKSQIQQQKLNLRIIQEQQKLNVNQYQLQFNNARTQLARTQIQLQNDDRNVKLAQQVYEVTTLQYRQGTKPLTDLINAENAYREAQSNYINSLINSYQARLDLEQSQGTLIDFFNQL